MNLLNSELPIGWHWRRVRDFYETTHKPRGLSLRSSEKVLFVPMDAIQQDGEFPPNYYLQKPISEIKSGTYFERGDLLVAKITPSFENGKQALLIDLPDSFAYGTTEVIPLRPISTTQDRRFLFYYLLHSDIRSYLTEKMEGSTGRQRVPENVLLDLPFPDINDSDQRTITNVLAMIQEASNLNKRALVISRELKRSVMQTLFTHGLQDEEQKETEFGPLPASWPLIKIKDAISLAQYGLSIRGQTEGQYPILRMNCQEDGKVLYRDLQFVNLDSKTSTAFQLNTGDILFNRTNSFELVGRSAIVAHDSKAVFASYLIRIKANKNIIQPDFFNYFLNWDITQSELKKLASRGVSQANISASKLKDFSIPIPALDEQQKIVAILDTIDQKIDLQNKKQTLLNDLFKTLLHKLLTGDIRVSEINLSALEKFAGIAGASA